MRKEQCLFCKSRKCYERVVSSEDGGKTYDEVACRKHAEKLREDSDVRAPGVMKYFISSTGTMRRGEDFEYE